MIHVIWLFLNNQFLFFRADQFCSRTCFTRIVCLICSFLIATDYSKKTRSIHIVLDKSGLFPFITTQSLCDYFEDALQINASISLFSGITFNAPFLVVIIDAPAFAKVSNSLK